MHFIESSMTNPRDSPPRVTAHQKPPSFSGQLYEAGYPHRQGADAQRRPAAPQVQTPATMPRTATHPVSTAEGSFAERREPAQQQL